MVNGIIDGMDSISAVDGYCRGAVFYEIELVKIKKKRASFSSRETLLSQKPIS